MQEIISVTGLGYVGLPLAVKLADHFKVIGYDIDRLRIKELVVDGRDRTREVGPQDLFKDGLRFTSRSLDISEATFHIIAVPTPIDEANRPDLKSLLLASETVGRALKHGDMVVYESTVYPGATEEDCIPVLESASGLEAGRDFKVGYSPERMNPGDREHGLAEVVKVIAAQDGEGIERMQLVYGSSVKELYVAPSIRVAEAAKIIENTQRDVNVALMNEFAIICDKIGIDTLDVLKTAATKWNFAPFRPGLVGGHCIGVDPYYLIEKAERLGYNPQMLKSCRRINDGMGKFIAQKAIKTLARRGGLPMRPIATILGFTFKENCPDVRNTKVMDIVAELSQFGFTVQVCDPLADCDQVFEDYGVQVKRNPNSLSRADIVVIATAHDDYKRISTDSLREILEIGGVVVDVKGVLSEDVRRYFNHPIIRI